MIVTEETLGKPLAFVITGNGRKELGVLRQIAKKYNGAGPHDVLYFPLSSRSSPLRKENRVTGIRALNSLKIEEVRQYGKVLCLIDREHISRNIRDNISTLGIFNSFNFKTNDEPYVIKGQIEQEDIILHLVILGKKKRLEENISELIKLMTSKKVKPEKESIKNFIYNCEKIREQEIDDYEDLIKVAKRKEIEKAFDNLTTAIKRLEGDPFEQKSTTERTKNEISTI